MHKRPIHPRFNDLIKSGLKTTTIQGKSWPMGVPIMLYNWTGKPYRSKQVDVVKVECRAVASIDITHKTDGDMLFASGMVTFRENRPLHETEGFASRQEMDAWFREVVPCGKTVRMVLNALRLVAETVNDPNHWLVEKAVQPTGQLMRRHGIMELTVKVDGSKLRFEADPEPEKPGEPVLGDWSAKEFRVVV